MSKSWKEKFETRKEPEIKKLEKAFADIDAGQTMLISTPAEIDEYLRHSKKGERLSVSKIRTDLAKKHGTDKTCPVTTGIFLRIVSEVAIEQMASGKSVDQVTPFWRALDEDSPLLKKLSMPAQSVLKIKNSEF